MKWIKFEYDEPTRSASVSFWDVVRITPVFSWLEWLRPSCWDWNWQTFEFVHIELEHEGCMSNFNGTFVVLGIGFYWHIQYAPFKSSREGSKISELFEEWKSSHDEKESEDVC